MFYIYCFRARLFFCSPEGSRTIYVRPYESCYIAQRSCLSLLRKPEWLNMASKVVENGEVDSCTRSNKLEFLFSRRNNVDWFAIRTSSLWRFRPWLKKWNFWFRVPRFGLVILQLSWAFHLWQNRKRNGNLRWTPLGNRSLRLQIFSQRILFCTTSFADVREFFYFLLDTRHQRIRHARYTQIKKVRVWYFK